MKKRNEEKGMRKTPYKGTRGWLICIVTALG